MSIMQYILAIAADLRAKDYAKLLQDFIGLIALVATVKTPDAATLAGQMPTLRAGAEVRTFDTDPDKLADECERFAHSQHAQRRHGRSVPADQLGRAAGPDHQAAAAHHRRPVSFWAGLHGGRLTFSAGCREHRPAPF
jgi:hypothetical protein